MRTWAWLVVALMLAGPEAVSADEGGTLLATLDAALADGRFTATATDGLLAAHETWFAAALSAESLTVTKVEIEQTRVRTPTGTVGVGPASREERAVFASVEATIAEHVGHVVVFATGPASTAWWADVEGATGHPLLVETHAATVHYGPASPEGFYFERAIDGLRFDDGADARRVEGDFRIFLANASIEMHSDGGRSRWEAWSRSDGVGERYAYLLLDVRRGTIDLAGRQGPGVEYALDEPTVDGQGRLLVRNATGSATNGATTYAAQGEDVALEGRYVVRFLPSRGEGTALHLLEAERRYVVTGSFERARIGDQVLADPALVGAGFLTLATVVAFLREAVARFFGACYTRIARADVLLNPERSRLLALVREDPGIHLRALQRASGHGWGKFHYHLGVLRRAGLLRLDRRGKYAHVLPTGAAADPARVLAARGAAATIYALVPADGGTTQRAVAEASGLSLQLSAHHLRRLAADGFVREVPGRPKRYVRARP